jgi:uncharacterized membrane protein
VSSLLSPASLVVLLAATATLSTARLLHSALSGKTLPGCGPGSACDEVTTGRWSRLGPFPATLPGTALYVVMLAAAVLVHPDLPNPLAARATAVLQFCSMMAAGAALWFTALQALVIRRFCRYCIFTHTCALLAAILVLREGTPSTGVWLAAVAALVLFAMGQVIIEPRLYSITQAAADVPSSIEPAPDADSPVSRSVPQELAGPAVSRSLDQAATSERHDALAPQSALPAAVQTLTAPPHAASAPAIPRRLHAVGQKISLSPHLWPILGNRDARHIIIDQFDYTCHYCRDLHKYLLRAAARVPAELAILMMPVPMESACNPSVKVTPQEHRNACIYTRYALAVFKATPEAFAEFDEWLFEPVRPHPLDDVKLKAQLTVGSDGILADALNDPWLTRRLNEAISIYDAVGQGQIPKLLFDKAVLSGPVPSYEELLKILKQTLGLSIPA